MPDVMLEGRKILVVWLGAAVGLICLAQFAYSCNEMVCASIVSKCMLTQSCKCDMKNCSCCKECSECLSYLYTECCSCLEMCPKPNETTNELSKQSHVEELEGFPNLFNVLTSEEDPEERWRIFTFPIDLDAAMYGSNAETGMKYLMREYLIGVDWRYS